MRLKLQRGPALGHRLLAPRSRQATPGVLQPNFWEERDQFEKLLVADFVGLRACSPALARQNTDSFTPHGRSMTSFGHHGFFRRRRSARAALSSSLGQGKASFRTPSITTTYRRFARVQTRVTDDNKVDGEWYARGRRHLRPQRPPHRKSGLRARSTLQRTVMMSRLRSAGHLPRLSLRSHHRRYRPVRRKVTWAGKRWTKWIATVFSVSSQTHRKEEALFRRPASGLDSTDLQIVVTNGRMVPDDTPQVAQDAFRLWCKRGTQ